jgi:hypothetical protein
MKELSPEARRLLESSRIGDDPSPGVQDRVERLLMRRIATAAGGAMVGSLAAKSAASAGGTAALVKTALVIGVAATALAAGSLAVHSAQPRGTLEAQPTRQGATQQQPPADALRPAEESLPAENRAHSSAENGSVGDTVAGGESDSAAADSAPSRLKRRVAAQPARTDEAASPGAASGVSETDQLLIETRGLRRMQRALRAGDARGALELLDREDEQHGAGLLQEERAAARVLALCRLGRISEARREAARFEERWPRSALAARVRSSCH